MDYLSFSKTHSMVHLSLELIFVYDERKRSSSSVFQVGTRALFNMGQFWPTVECLLTIIPKPCVLRHFFIMAFMMEKPTHGPLENPLTILMLSFPNALCSNILMNVVVFYSAVDAKLTLQRSPELYLLEILSSLVRCPVHSSCLDLSGIPTLSIPLRETTQFHLLALYCEGCLMGIMLGILQDSDNLSFLCQKSLTFV